IAVLVGGLGAIIATIPLIWDLFWKKRLVIGKDRLQLVRGSRKVVLGSIPYDNVVEVRVGSSYSDSDDRAVEHLEIALLKRRRSDTWWPSLVSGEDYDVVIRDRFEKPPRQTAHEGNRLGP